MKNTILLFLVLILATQSVIGQETDVEETKHSILTDKFLLDAGLFFPQKTVKLGVDGTATTDINEGATFDETLSFDDTQNTFNSHFMWRFSKNWNLNSEFFKIKSQFSEQLEKDIIWGDYTFNAGVNASVGYSLGLLKINVGRVISRGQKHEFSGSLGFHGVNISTFIEGEAYVNNASAGFKNERVETLLPLPNIGLWYYWAPDTKWAVTTSVDWFGIKVDNFAGELWNINAGVNYQAFKNIGFGIIYKYFDLSANVDKDSWSGSVSTKFQGPALLVSGNL